MPGDATPGDPARGPLPIAEPDGFVPVRSGPGDAATAPVSPDRDRGLDGDVSPGNGIDWAAVSARVGELADDPELLTLTRAVVENGPPASVAAAVHTALVEALGRSTSPGLVGECLSMLLDSRPALDNVGSQLYDLCVRRARPHAESVTPKDWLLAADALEAATRLALGDWAPRYGVLAELVRVPIPAPPSYARAALRCLAASYEQWRDPDLFSALERFAGLAPGLSVAGPVQEWAHEVAPDAAYELGCASLLQALAGETVSAAEEHLTTAAIRLQVAATDREDAAILGTVVALLAAHLPSDAGRAAYADTDLSVLANTLDRGVREHILWSAGLEHWRAPRLDAEVAWARLARDVARTQSALAEASWYQAESTLADVLAVWTASRCSRVLRRSDHAGVRAILGPNISSGIAVQAGLMKHLEDHIEALEATGPTADTAADGQAGHTGVGTALAASSEEARTGQLEAARSLLAEARAQLASGDSRPKRSGSASGDSPDGGLPALPRLIQLLGGDGDALGAVPTEVARQLEDALTIRAQRPGLLTVDPVTTTATGAFTPQDSLVVAETFHTLRRQLAGSRWYTGEVAEVVDQLLLHLLRFWRSRDGMGPAQMPYLFKVDAVEEDLARDLKAYFDASAMASLLSTEVRHIGGGRVDVACSFPRYRLVIELKKDHRQIDMSARQRFLAQAAGYQSADVPLGVLAVLDLRPWAGATPFLTSCFGVAVLDDADLGEPRYVVTMALPGNRTTPSAMR